MSSKRILAIVLRQLYLLRHNKTRFVNIFLWVVLDIILWGFLTRYLDTIGSTTFSFVPVLLGALVLWDFLIRVQQGVMLAFFEDVWTQNFLNFFASPLSVGEYVKGIVLTSILTSAAGLVLMLLLSGIAFGLSLFSLGIILVPFILILFIFGMALGIFASGFVLRLGPSAEWLAWPIPFMIAPLAGVYYPVSTLPSVLEFFSRILPPSYVFEGMRAALFTGTVSWSSLLIGLVLSLIFLALSYTFFVRIYKTVLRSGLLSRFSAEYVP